MKHTVEEIILTSGARGLLIHVPGAPVMSFDFHLRAGYYLAPPGKWDTPHVLEHLMFGANKTYQDEDQFKTELEKNGAYANAWTGNWGIVYEAQCAAFEWERVLGIIGTSLTEPLLQDKQLKSEIGNVYEELSGNLNHYFRVLAVEVNRANGLQALSDKDRLLQLSQISAADVRAHFVKTHTQHNIRFIIGGNLTPSCKSKLIELLETIYASLPPGERFELPVERPTGLVQPLIVERSQVEKLHYSIDFFYPHSQLSSQEEDAFRLLYRILTGSTTSLIYGKARNQGITYDIGSSFSNSHTFASWGFGGNVGYSNATSLFRLVGEELKKILNGDLDAKHIEAAKLQSLGRFQMSSQRVEDLTSGYSDEYFYDGQIEDYRAIPDRITAVSKARIINSAQKVLEEKCWSVGLLGTISQVEADSLQGILQSTIYR